MSTSFHTLYDTSIQVYETSQKFIKCCYKDGERQKQHNDIFEENQGILSSSMTK